MRVTLSFTGSTNLVVETLRGNWRGEAASTYKRRETDAMLWLLIERIIFLTRRKNIVRSSDG